MITPSSVPDYALFESRTRWRFARKPTAVTPSKGQQHKPHIAILDIGMLPLTALKPPANLQARFPRKF
jgi:hypothetical protein